MRLFVAAYPPADACADLGALVARLALGQPPAPGRSLGLQPPERWHLTLAFLGDVPDDRLERARDAVRRAVAAFADAAGLDPAAVDATGVGATVMETDPGGAVVDTDPGGAVMETDPGGAVVNADPGGAVVNADPGGAVVNADPGGVVAGTGPGAARRGRTGAAAVAGSGPGGPVLRIRGGGRFGRGRFTTLWAGVHGDLYGLRDLAGAVRRELRRAKLPYDAKPLRPHITLARPGDRLPPELIAADLAALAAYEGPQWTVDEVRLVRSHLGPKPRYEAVGRFTLAPSGTA